MIPKIIHLCWLSGDEYPNNIKECLKTWKEILPDYEIWIWDTKRFDVNSTIWTKQAFENKKYAFAADYIRLYALFNYGGIYLDSDVTMYKSFNDLLTLPYFIGQDYTHAFETAVIGAEKGIPWIGKILERYTERSFIKTDGSFDTMPLPLVFYEELKSNYLFYKLHSLKVYSLDNTIINVFDKDFFNSRNNIQARKTSKSYCAHNFAGSWSSTNTNLKSRIQRNLPKWILSIYFYIAHRTFNKRVIGKYEPKFENK